MDQNHDTPDPLNDDGTYALAPTPEPERSPEAHGDPRWVAPPQTSPPTPPTSTEPPQTRPNRVEICANCGYNLTGLALTTACPECGSSERRLQTTVRPIANAGWLTTLSRGISLAWAAIVLASITSLAQLVFGPGSPTPWLGGLSIDGSLMALAKLLGAVALFILTQPNPALLGPGAEPHTNAPNSDSRQWWPIPPRDIARYGALAFGTAQLLILAASLAFPGPLSAFQLAAAVIAIPTLFAGLTHAADLFEQLGQNQQAFETRILRFGWLLTLLGTTAYFLALPGFSPGSATNPFAVVLILLIVVFLFWSLALLIHLGQAVRGPLANAD